MNYIIEKLIDKKISIPIHVFNDKEFIKELCILNYNNYKDIIIDQNMFKNSKKIIIDIFKNLNKSSQYNFFKKLPEKFKTNKKLVLSLLSIHSSLYELLNDSMKKDFCIIKIMIKIDRYTLSYSIPNNILENKKFIHLMNSEEEYMNFLYNLCIVRRKNFDHFNLFNKIKDSKEQIFNKMKNNIIFNSFVFETINNYDDKGCFFDKNKNISIYSIYITLVENNNTNDLSLLKFYNKKSSYSFDMNHLIFYNLNNLYYFFIKYNYLPTTFHELTLFTRIYIFSKYIKEKKLNFLLINYIKICANQSLLYFLRLLKNDLKILDVILNKTKILYYKECNMILNDVKNFISFKIYKNKDLGIELFKLIPFSENIPDYISNNQKLFIKSLIYNKINENNDFSIYKIFCENFKKLNDNIKNDINVILNVLRNINNNFNLLNLGKILYDIKFIRKLIYFNPDLFIYLENKMLENCIHYIIDKLETSNRLKNNNYLLYKKDVIKKALTKFPELINSILLINEHEKLIIKLINNNPSIFSHFNIKLKHKYKSYYIHAKIN